MPPTPWVGEIRYDVSVTRGGTTEEFSTTEEPVMEYKTTVPAGTPEADVGHVRARGEFTFRPIPYTSLGVTVEVRLPAASAVILSGEADEIATALVEDRIATFTGRLLTIFSNIQGHD